MSREGPENSLRLEVRLTPRARSDEVVSYAAGVLHLRLTAPPVEGAANAACCAFVAELLGVRKSQVAVMLGQKSRTKVLSIESLSADAAAERLSRYAPPGGTSAR